MIARFLFRQWLLSPAWLLPAGVSLILSAAPLEASEVRIFRADTREALIEGEFDGVSLGPLGVLSLAHRAERLASLEEPFVFDAASHPEGVLIGTGNAGKVLLARSSGDVEELFSTEEPEVFAVLTGRDGSIYAAASPYGKIYRLRPGADEPEVVAATGAAYVWDLAEDDAGRLLIATGLAGHLYRVDPAAASAAGDDATAIAELLFESPDSHVRSLAVRPDGRVLLGTAGQGLLIELAFERRGGREVAVATTLVDAVQPEVLGLTVDADGHVYAAALASEASLLDLSQTQPPPQSNGEDGGEAAVTVTNQTKDTVGSRASVYTGPRSVVLRAKNGGEIEELTTFQNSTVHTLLWHAEALWIGTGQEGRIFRFAGGELFLERTVDERQVVALVPGPAAGEAAAVATNSAAVYRLAGDAESAGTYTSPVLDAEQVARFGTFSWRGESPRGAELELEGRSGMSGIPDGTWTSWIAAVASADGREFSFAAVPPGRFVQWRATLRAQNGNRDAGPQIRISELSYRQENQRPVIASFEALSPGEILVPQNFNPQSQTFEPWTPNREGIFTTLRADGNGEASRLKTLYKKGFRSLRWEASDGNEDDLLYALDFRRESAPAEGAEDDGWLPIIDELDQSYYSFDSSVLPDGVYRFRLRVADRTPAAAEEALVAERTSAPVVVDHTAPALISARWQDGAIEAEIRDALSPLRDVVTSADAGEWIAPVAGDGLVDGRGETLRVAVPEGARMLLLRVTDAAWNVITFDLIAAAGPESR